MTLQNAAPEIVVELTKSYLHKLSDGELHDHFRTFSNRFSDMLNSGSEEELEMLQSYLRLITLEMSVRLNSSNDA